MGIEHKWGALLCRAAQGRTFDYNPEEQRAGTTPNQKAQWRALSLAHAIQTKDENAIDIAVKNCISYIRRQQKYGHMCTKMEGSDKHNNEMLIAAAHYPIWILAKAVMYKYAFDNDTAKDLRPFIQWWWDVEARICKMFATPSGQVVCPATRWIPQPNVEPSYQRSVFHRSITGLGQVGPAARTHWWRMDDPQNAGTALISGIYNPGDPGVDFHFYDAISVLHTTSGHKAWAPNGLHAMKPVPYASVDYETGAISYEPFDPAQLPQEYISVITIEGSNTGVG